MKDIIIDPSWELFEAAYQGNIGIMEIAKFYKKANPEQRARFDELVARTAASKGPDPEAWEEFKALMKEVTGVQLL